MDGWQFVKHRTAADDGSVWRSADGSLYKRIGGPDVAAEAAFQMQLFRQGFPVPEIVETGEADGVTYFIERSAGEVSIHDLALASAGTDGALTIAALDAATTISKRLLQAQASNTVPADAAVLRSWFAKASFVDNVFEENPDFDNPRTRSIIAMSLDRLEALPLCSSHLDYGLPNAFPQSVIDWQHGGFAPLGFDAYPMLEIAAFKGGNRGYEVTSAQALSFRNSLDATLAMSASAPLSTHLGDFLLVKCFFFLALMRPESDGRQDKHLKWQYRRALFESGLEQYETDGAIRTDRFPTLVQFSEAIDLHR